MDTVAGIKKLISFHLVALTGEQSAGVGQIFGGEVVLALFFPAESPSTQLIGSSGSASIPSLNSRSASDQRPAWAASTPALCKPAWLLLP